MPSTPCSQREIFRLLTRKRSPHFSARARFISSGKSPVPGGCRREKPTSRSSSDVLVASGSRGTKFFPGAIESLKLLRQNGIKVALVTNKMRAITISLLESRDALGLFDTIVAADDTDHPKPAGDMLVLAMKRLGTAPEQTVMVGDSRNDALAGRAAGTRVLLVNTGYNEGEPIDLWAEKNGFAKSLDGIVSVASLLLHKNACV